MAMTEIEKGLFLRLFNRGGYVLNFTTSSFDTFTKSSIALRFALITAYRKVDLSPSTSKKNLM